MDTTLPPSTLTLAYSGASAFEALPDAYVILDESRNVVAANASYCTLLGVTLDALQGRSIYEINQSENPAHALQRQVFLDTLLDGLTVGAPRSTDTLAYDLAIPDPVTGKLRTARFWSVRASRWTDAALHRDFIALLVCDVSAAIEQASRDREENVRLRAQWQTRELLLADANKRLEYNQRRLRHALAFAQIGTWEIDREKGTLSGSAQFNAALGIGQSPPLTASAFFERVDPRDRERVRDAFASAFSEPMQFLSADSQRIDVEFRVHRQGVAEHWLLLRGKPSEDMETTAAVLGFAMDISGRKRIEIRHSEIAESERQARHRSDATARAMDHFVTAVSHELRSPVNAVLSWADVLRRLPEAHVAVKGAEAIERNARQLSHMVDDLLDTGAIATGKLSVDRQPVDLAALAAGVIEDVRLHPSSKHLNVKTTALTSCMVLADEKRMTQVIWNLLSNAVKFTDGGDVEVSVTCDLERAYLRVRDTGRGIAPDILNDIFNRFAQSSTRGAGRVAGLGLGLWLVKNLVWLHDGEVSAFSDGPGCGAVFTVSLPLYG